MNRPASTKQGLMNKEKNIVWNNYVEGIVWHNIQEIKTVLNFDN